MRKWLTIYKIELGIATLKEAITFYNGNTIVFTDEVFRGIGRNAYVIKLDQANKVPMSVPSK